MLTQLHYCVTLYAPTINFLIERILKGYRMNYVNVAEIEQRREARGLTHEKLAELTGMNRIAIGNMLRVGSMSIGSAMKFCRAMQIEPNDLFVGWNWETEEETEVVEDPQTVA